MEIQSDKLFFNPTIFGKINEVQDEDMSHRDKKDSNQAQQSQERNNPSQKELSQNITPRKASRNTSIVLSQFASQKPQLVYSNSMIEIDPDQYEREPELSSPLKFTNLPSPDIQGKKKRIAQIFSRTRLSLNSLANRNINLQDDQDCDAIIDILKKPQRSIAECNILQLAFHNLSFFKTKREELSDQLYLMLFSQLRHQFFPKQSVVFNEGDFGYTFYIILRGKVNIIGKSKKEASLSNLDEGYLEYLQQQKKDQYSRLTNKMQSERNIKFVKQMSTPKRNNSQTEDQSSMTNINSQSETDLWKLFMEAYHPQMDVIAQLGVGQEFGEIALIAKSRRTATIICKQDTDFLTLDSQGFDQILGKIEEQKSLQKIRFLRKFEIFTKGHNSSLMFLLQEIEQVEFTYNQIVYQQNIEPEFFYLIQKGSFLIQKLVEDQNTTPLFSEHAKLIKNYKPVEVKIIGEQNCFGDIEIFLECPRKFQVTCLSTQSLVCKLPQEQLLNYVRKMNIMKSCKQDSQDQFDQLLRVIDQIVIAKEQNQKHFQKILRDNTPQVILTNGKVENFKHQYIHKELMHPYIQVKAGSIDDANREEYLGVNKFSRNQLIEDSDKICNKKIENFDKIVNGSHIKRTFQKITKKYLKQMGQQADPSLIETSDLRRFLIFNSVYGFEDYSHSLKTLANLSRSVTTCKVPLSQITQLARSMIIEEDTEFQQIQYVSKFAKYNQTQTPSPEQKQPAKNVKKLQKITNIDFKNNYNINVSTEQKGMNKNSSTLSLNPSQSNTNNYTANNNTKTPVNDTLNQYYFQQHKSVAEISNSMKNSQNNTELLIVQDDDYSDQNYSQIFTQNKKQQLLLQKIQHIPFQEKEKLEHAQQIFSIFSHTPYEKVLNMDQKGYSTLPTTPQNKEIIMDGNNQELNNFSCLELSQGLQKISRDFKPHQKLKQDIKGFSTLNEFFKKSHIQRNSQDIGTFDTLLNSQQQSTGTLTGIQKNQSEAALIPQNNFLSQMNFIAFDMPFIGEQKQKEFQNYIPPSTTMSKNDTHLSQLKFAQNLYKMKNNTKKQIFYRAHPQTTKNANLSIDINQKNNNLLGYKPLSKI